MTRRLRAIALLALASLGIASAEDALVLSIAPFKTFADPAYAYLGESFSEAFATKLVGLKGVRLYERGQFERIADELKLERASAELFDQETVSRVGKVVAIDYLLLGSTTLAGDRLACEVRLVNVNTGKGVLAREFRAAFPAGMFEMQEQAAIAIAAALELNLTDFDLRRLGRKPTADMDAFGLYNSGLAAKDAKERIGLLEKAVARDPAFVQALGLLADMYEEAGRSADARRTYARLLETDPEDYRAAYNLALLHLDACDIAASVALLERCAEMKGENADILYHRGLASEFGAGNKRFGQGADLAAARAFYGRATAADPRHGEAWRALGTVCASIAQSSADPEEQIALVRESIASLRRYLELSPVADDKAEIEINLELLGGAEADLAEYLKNRK